MSNKAPAIQVSSAQEWVDYELIDSGDGLKLERFGKYTFSRPEAQAVWSPARPAGGWLKADAVFQTTAEENGGHWLMNKKLPEYWTMEYKGIKFKVQAGASRHLGVFPEQAVHWDWMTAAISGANRPVKVLNLFGYTGIASLFAAKAGAQVTHIDASKKAISWARENQSLSSLNGSPIRWIVDDALKFIEREIRRGSFYDGIILDPPKFGRGPKGEVWEFYKLLPTLLNSCKEVLAPNPLFILLTAYAVKASSITLKQAVEEIMRDFHGTTTAGEIGIREKSAGRFLSTAIFSRWLRAGI